MFKKILIIFLVLAVLFAAGANVLYRRAPGFLRDAMQKSLGKPVEIRSIEYRFPNVFVLEGFVIRENSPFESETAFSVDKVTLTLSPMSMSKKALLIDKIEAQNASAVIRKFQGRLIHAFSDAPKEETSSQLSAPDGQTPAKSGASMPLEIDLFKLSGSHFQFIDYDIQQGGFVFGLEDIAVEVRHIRFPFKPYRTDYELSAQVIQGRDQRPAAFQAKGWTDFESLDTEANVGLSGLFLPYFQPYYAKVTPSAIQEGWLDIRQNLVIQGKVLTDNVDLELKGLSFQGFESGNELMGFNAEQFLSYLKNAGGNLRLQTVIQWNLADPSVKPADVIRQSLKQSIKNIILGNVGTLLETTLRTIGEKGVDGTKDELEGTLKKLGKIFQ